MSVAAGGEMLISGDDHRGLLSRGFVGDCREEFLDRIFHADCNFYYFFQVKGAWYTALVPGFVAVWESIPHVLSFATMLTIFKEGVDVMLTRLQEYRDSVSSAVSLSSEPRNVPESPIL